MTHYSDADIFEAQYRDSNNGSNWLRIEPFDRAMLQPASVDLTLGTGFVVFKMASEIGYGGCIDMRDRNVPSYPVDVGKGSDAFFELRPGQCVLGATVERIELGARVWAKIEGKSSLGRMGLAVHVTAGFVDPGFRGQVTLELYNLNPNPIRLRPGLAICQVAFGELMTRADRPYGTPGLGSRYQDQVGAIPVRV